MAELFTFHGFSILALAVTAVAATVDYRTGHIPNWLTVGALLGGMVMHLTMGFASEGGVGLRSAALTLLAGVGLCSAVPLLLRLIAGMGGGDLKLLAALGAICGPLLGFRAQTYAFIAMFLYVLVRLVYEGNLSRMLLRMISVVAWRSRPPRSPVSATLVAPLRFGPAIFVGLCLALLTS